MKLNLKNVEKKVLDLTLPDGTEITVMMPKKTLFEDLQKFEAKKNYQINDVYLLLSKLLSQNIENKKITVKYLEDILDYEDILNLYKGYITFVRSEIENPN